MSHPALALLLCLGARVLEASASVSEQSTFFKPLTCDQDPSHRHKCGGEAESFYPHQCLLKKCCYLNNTCYHHTIDGTVQRHNAGIVGGTCVTVFVLGACIFYGCKSREFQRKEKLSEGPVSEGNTDECLVRLLDDESIGETESQEGTGSLQPDDSWTQRRGSKQVGWSTEPLELGEIHLRRKWSPETASETTPETTPELPQVNPEPPPLVPEPLPPAPEAPLPALDTQAPPELVEVTLAESDVLPPALLPPAALPPDKPDEAGE